MRFGRRLGLDYGSVRVGVAISDPSGVLATPYETLRLEVAITELARIVEDEEIIEIVLGLPKHLNGLEGASAGLARAFAEDLRICGVPIRFVDERSSTVSAAAHLRQSGRNAKTSKSIIDQATAVIILQSALDAEMSGRPPGEVLI
jgi:putative Holliday junction resolvase